MTRRALLRATGRVLLLSTLGACAAIAGPRTLRLSQAQLLEALAGQMPFKLRGLDLFDIVAATPRLRFLPQSNRIATEFDLGLTDKLLGRRFDATLGASYGLRIEPKDHTLRLSSLQLERLDLAGQAVSLDTPLGRVGRLAAEAFLQDAVLYTFRPEDLSIARGLGYTPGSIRVEPDGLALTLDPS